MIISSFCSRRPPRDLLNSLRHDSKTRERSSRGRRAASLLELLAVVTIILLITGIAIRTVMPAIETRQLREGARQFNVFINSARNRAMTTGRPMGIWVDRMSGLPEASMSVSYAQVPEPYSGDYADSGAEAFLLPDTSSNSTYGTRRYLNVIRAGPASGMRYGLFDFWCLNKGGYTPQRIIRPGDSIQLNYRSQSYRLLLDSSIQQIGPVWAIGWGLNKNFYQDVNYDSLIWANPNGGWWYTINYFNDLGDRVMPVATPGSSATTFGRPVPYQIFRQPIRSAAGTMQFPETVLIDLNFSGDDLKNYFPRTGDTVAISSSYGYVDPYQGTPAFPNDTTPIIIMFNPSGAIEQVYTRYYQAPATTSQRGTWTWRGDRQMSPISFLIGSRDNVPADPTSNWTAQLKNNWTQPANIWVAIQPRSGLVTSGEVVPPQNYLGTTLQTMNRDAMVTRLVWSYLTADQQSTGNARGYSARGNQMSGQ